MFEVGEEHDLREAYISVPLDEALTKTVLVDSVRLFRWNFLCLRWILVSISAVAASKSFTWGRVHRPGVYAAIGLPRDEERIRSSSLGSPIAAYTPGRCTRPHVNDLLAATAEIETRIQRRQRKFQRKSRTESTRTVFVSASSRGTEMYASRRSCSSPTSNIRLAKVGAPRSSGFRAGFSVRDLGLPVPPRSNSAPRAKASPSTATENGSNR